MSTTVLPYRRTAASLAEIMDEELAAKLQADETPNINDTDPDLLLALRLQAEFDAADAREDSLADNAAVERGRARACPSRLCWLGDQLCDSFDDDGDDGGQDGPLPDDVELLGAADADVDDLAAELAGKEQGKKQHQELVKTGGRQMAKNSVTKHDVVRNAERNGMLATAKWHLDAVASGDTRGTKIPNRTYNELKQHAQRAERQAARIKDNDLKETHASVLDVQTRLVLFSLLSQSLMSDLGGIIATGKESVVFSCDAQSELDTFQVPAVVKVFKTTLNEFTNRSEYMNVQPHASRHSRLNPRKVIKLWAQKEFSNLQRLHAIDGISCPRPLLLRKHVVAMSLVAADDGRPAPQLRRIVFPTASSAGKVYVQAIMLLRRMYQSAQLVHGDLSEYNLLLANGRLWVIDVSQAVNTDAANALAFLKRDVANINRFFARTPLGLGGVLSDISLFAFVTDFTLRVADEAGWLERAQARLEAAEPDDAALSAQARSLFLSTPIPSTLASLDPYHPSLDVIRQAEFVSGLSELNAGATVCDREQM